MTKEEITDRSQQSDLGDFKSDNPRLDLLYRELVAKAVDAIEWYGAARWKKRIATMLVRWTAALSLGAAAALVALQATKIGALTLFCWTLRSSDFSVAQLCLAGVGSGVLVLDNIFGFSTGWVRYMLTEQAIQKALDDFKMDWAIAVMAAAQKPSDPPAGAQGADAVKALADAQTALDAAKAAADAAKTKAEAAGATEPDKQAALTAAKAAADAQAAFDEAKAKADAAAVRTLGGGVAVLQQLLKTFSTKIDALVSDETQQWVLDFQSSMALLQRNARDVQPTSTSGSLSITITRASGVDAGVMIEVDGQKRAETTANTVVLSNIPAGIRQVRVTGKKAGATIENFAAATVTANAVATVSVSLP